MWWEGWNCESALRELYALRTIPWDGSEEVMQVRVRNFRTAVSRVFTLLQLSSSRPSHRSAIAV